MAIEALPSTQTEGVPTLRSVYPAGKPAAVDLPDFDAVVEKLDPLELERSVSRSIHVVSDRYSKTLGSAVLFYRKKISDIHGYLYFGLVGNKRGFKSGQLDLVMPNNARIPLFLLNVEGRFDHDEVVLFAFESNKKFDTIKLVKDHVYISDEEHYFAGFQQDCAFTWDVADDADVDYYPLAEDLQKFYARGLMLMPHQTYSYQNAFYGWSRQVEDFHCPEHTLILHGMTFKNTLPGSIVVNNEGRVEGIFKCSVNKRFALICDLAPHIKDLKTHLAGIVKRHKPRQYRAG